MIRGLFDAAADRVSRVFFERDIPVSNAAVRNSVLPTAYMHIPKCAGMSFNKSMIDALEAKAPLSGFDLCLFGGFDRFDTFSPELMTAIYRTAPIPAGADLVCGHFALSNLRFAYGEANFCTVLREPFSRLLSHWLYWRQLADSEMTPWGLFADLVARARRPLAEFLRDPELAAQTDNLAVRMLLWPDARIPADGFITPNHDKALLKDALVRLRSFDFFDYLENPALVNNVSDWLGLPFQLHSINETRPTQREFPVDLCRELTPVCHALLESRSRLDQRLWREAVKTCTPGVSFEALHSEVWRRMVQHHQEIQRVRAA